MSGLLRKVALGPEGLQSPSFPGETTALCSASVPGAWLD